MIYITENDLNQYRAIKKEITDIEKRINSLKAAEVVSFGTVKGSDSSFPYTPKNFHVAGIDPSDASRRNKHISQLLRQREFQRTQLVKKQIEIEEFISEIDNSTTRTIFRKYFIDGLNQLQIAKEVNYSQGRVAQIIKGYLKINKINKVI